MKPETKKGVGALIVATVTTVALAARARAAPPIVCASGEEKCIGANWCRCNPAGTKWIVVTPNATQCAAPPLTAVLYGMVSDAETGGPIDGILVDCGGYTDSTGVDGTYRIEGIPPGEYSVTFCDPLSYYESLTI